jgi:hypothetical protein
MIQKLIILIKNPNLAAKVRTVTHCCHLPGPDLFEELRGTSFSGQSLSSDWRTIDLLRLAIRNMVNVHTLRLYFPHYNIGRVLLSDFFDRSRPCEAPVRRLWLENCDLFFDNLYMDSVNLTGLESIRIRRIQSHYSPSGSTTESSHVCLARGGWILNRLDGAGSVYQTWHHSPDAEDQSRPRLTQRSPFYKAVPTQEVDRCKCPASVIYDKHIYNGIPEASEVLEVHWKDITSLPSLNGDTHVLDEDYEATFNNMFTYESNDVHLFRMLRLSVELKHLNLDWFVVPYHNRIILQERQASFLGDLSVLRFKNLKSFQYRNAVSNDCCIPSNVWLLHPSELVNKLKVDFLSFMENHPRLICLGWPIDQFFPEVIDFQYRERIQKVVLRLGILLETLRLDAQFRGSGEPQNGESRLPIRRHFIQNFAVHMKSVQTIKMEVR